MTSTGVLERLRRILTIRVVHGTLDNLFGAVLVTTIAAALLEHGGGMGRV